MADQHGHCRLAAFAAPAEIAGQEILEVDFAFDHAVEFVFGKAAVEISESFTRQVPIVDHDDRAAVAKLGGAGNQPRIGMPAIVEHAVETGMVEDLRADLVEIELKHFGQLHVDAKHAGPAAPAFTVLEVPPCLRDVRVVVAFDHVDVGEHDHLGIDVPQLGQVGLDVP